MGEHELLGLQIQDLRDRVNVQISRTTTAWEFGVDRQQIDDLNQIALELREQLRPFRQDLLRTKHSRQAFNNLMQARRRCIEFCRQIYNMGGSAEYRDQALELLRNCAAPLAELAHSFPASAPSIPDVDQPTRVHVSLQVNETTSTALPPPPTGSLPARSQIFISYSHKDRRWLTKLRAALRPLVRNQTITLWDDTMLRAGSRWQERIAEELEAANVAILLVSHNFLASDFIFERELPPILKAAEQSGLSIIWVAVGASNYKETYIADYQAANDPARPLNSLRSSDQDRELVHICEQIKMAAIKTERDG